MIFDHMEFHNVEEMEKSEKGYIMWRVPESLRGFLTQGAAEKAARFGTGVEIRFKMKSDRVILRLCAEPMEEAQMACIYYGDFQGGWTNSTRTILQTETELVIDRADNLPKLREIARECAMGFDPEVVRLVLPAGLVYYIGVEGEVEPPAKEDMPARTYLAYGSSITHGSLGLAFPFSYPFLISQRLCCDYLNMGFAGSACAEEKMAGYLCARKDWDFASVELGVNMLREDYSPELFEKRVSRFVEIMAEDKRPVFITDLFGHNNPWKEKTAKYREIVQRLSAGRLIYTNGLQLLNHPGFISQDMTHPDARGQLAIADNWCRVMKESLNFV